MLNLRLARFEHLVDIGRVGRAARASSAATGTSRSARRPATSVIERDATVAADVPLLAAATPYIGHFQIRNRGTIGGSLAHADPAAEYPAVAVALDATFQVASCRRHPRRARRRVLHRRVVDGAGGRRAAHGDRRAGVDRAHAAFGVAEFARRHGDFAIAGAVAAVELADDRVGRAPAIAVFGVGRRCRCGRRAAEQALTGQPVGDAATPPSWASWRSPTSTTSPTTRRCRPPTAGGSARRWSPRRGSGPSPTPRTEHDMADPVTVALTVNGAPRRMAVEPRKTLADVLREDLAGSTGTHLGCEHGVCGACTVLLDGDAVAVLPDVRRAGRRRRGRHRRGPGARRRAAQRRAAGDARLPRAAVRLLHAGLRRVDHGAARAQPRPRRRGDPRRRCPATSAAAPATRASSRPCGWPRRPPGGRPS